MPDINLSGIGIGGFFGAVATIGLGLLGALIAFVVAVSVREPELGRRLRSYCAGPLACAAVGVVAIFLRLSWDGWFFVWPVVGVFAAVVTALAARREDRGAPSRSRR